MVVNAVPEVSRVSGPRVFGCPKVQAEQYVARLLDAYPDVAGYLDLLRRELIITGQVTTWRGRTRTVTAHRWMVDEARVRVLLIPSCSKPSLMLADNEQR